MIAVEPDGTDPREAARFVESARAFAERTAAEADHAEQATEALHRALEALLDRQATQAALVRAVTEEATRRSAQQARVEALLELSEAHRERTEEVATAARRDARELEAHADGLERRLRVVASRVGAPVARRRRVVEEPADGDELAEAAGALRRLAERLEEEGVRRREAWDEERELARLVDRKLGEAAQEADDGVEAGHALDSLLRSRLHLDELVLELRRRASDIDSDVARAWQTTADGWRRQAVDRERSRALRGRLDAVARGGGGGGAGAGDGEPGRRRGAADE